MKKSTTSILSILVDRITIEQVLEKIKKSLSGKPQILPIVSINPEIVMLADKQPTYKNIINSSYLRLPDGIGIILAVTILRLPKLTRITGFQLTKKLANKASVWSIPVGLIGGEPKVAVEAGKRLSAANPKLQWWAEEGPVINLSRELGSRSAGQIFNKSQLVIANYQFFDPKNEYQLYNFNALIEKINRTRTSILFCAFGAPKQEFFVEELKKYESKLKRPLITVSVGGVFDELAGVVSPTPHWIDRIGVKWFWRLIHQPWRWKRQISLVKFVLRVCPIRLR